MIAAAVGLVEIWRRGYLDKLIASVNTTAKAGADVPKREFNLPTAYMGGGTEHLS